MPTYDEILTGMQQNFEDLAGFSADEASDIGIRLKVLASEIFSLYSNLDWVKKQMFANTATDQSLEKHAQERGISRKNAVYASGVLKFSRSSALTYDINIPAGTVCSTSGSEPLRYETTQDVVLESGSLNIAAPAIAQTAGEGSNTTANTITVLITPPAGITAVTNESAFTGGTEAETDDELRKRVLNNYLNISNGTNSAFYKNMAETYEGIHSASAVALARGVGTLDLYVAAKGAVPNQTLIEQIQTDISALREINVDIQVKAPTLLAFNASIILMLEQGYDFTTVKNNCIAAVQEYFNSLAIGENVLLAHIGNAIYKVAGIKNYTMVSTNQDKTVPNNSLGVVGTISFSQGV